VEPIGFDLEGHASRPVGRTGFSIYKKAGDVAFQLSVHHDCLPRVWWRTGFLRKGSADWPRPFPSITNFALLTFVL